MITLDKGAGSWTLAQGRDVTSGILARVTIFMGSIAGTMEQWYFR